MNDIRVENPTTSSSSDPRTIHPNNLRYHYLDNLRALAILLGVFFHASFAYLPMSAEIWAVADVNKSLGLQAAALIFLPLVLAGIIGVIVYAAYTTENKLPMLL